MASCQGAILKRVRFWNECTLVKVVVGNTEKLVLGKAHVTFAGTLTPEGSPREQSEWTGYMTLSV
jgi:hypothetical protein